MCTAVPYSLAETPQLPIPPHLGSYTRVLLVSQNRRHLFVTPCVPLSDDSYLAGRFFNLLSILTVFGSITVFRMQNPRFDLKCCCRIRIWIRIKTKTLLYCCDFFCLCKYVGWIRIGLELLLFSSHLDVEF